MSSLTPFLCSRYVPPVFWTPPSSPPEPEKLGPAAIVALILTNVCNSAAAALVRRSDLTPMLRLLWSRLQRTIRRFARLAELVAQNRLPPPRPPRKRPETPEQTSKPERAKKLRLPQGFAWLLPLVPMVGNYGSQLEHLLQDPEMLALIEAAPQAKRLLRPILHMLGRRPPPLLALPARPRKPRPKKPRTPRERRPTHFEVFGRKGTPGWVPPTPRNYRRD